MFNTFKTWKLAAALKAHGNATEAYAAVLELGRMRGDKAVDLLISALARKDGVARSAARELGRMRETRALEALGDLLGDKDMGRSAAEALLQSGPAAVDAVCRSLQSESAEARRQAAHVLGEIGDRRPVESLVQILAHDPAYAVRTAAATALGQLKDPRAVWVLVATLKLRDETTSERQAELRSLQQAAELAMRKIGDLLGGPIAAAGGGSAAQAVAQLERDLAESVVHPRLIGDLALLSHAELVSVLKEIIGASEEISWAKLERREPILAPYFREYEQRRQAAEVIGRELRRRGGASLLQSILASDLGGSATIRNWWEGAFP